MSALRGGSALVLAVGSIAGCSMGSAAVQDQAVVIAYPAGLESPGPDMPHEEFALSILGNVYEALVETDADQGIGPGLAEYWYTPDDRTWVFKLRQGVRLHDGRTLTAGHVAVALQRTRATEASTRGLSLEPLERVLVRDARTVVVHTRHPCTMLPIRLAHAYIWADSLRDGGLPAGTGPYRVRSIGAEGTTVLEAFREHWRGAPEVSRVVFRVVPRARERLSMIRNGEVDVAVDLPPGARGDLAVTPRLRRMAQSSRRVIFLGMGTERSSNVYVSTERNPFRDVRIRRALAHAVDPEGLVEGALGGEAEVATQLVAPGANGYGPAIQAVPYDLQRARALLNAAGFPDGFATTLDYAEGAYSQTGAVVRRLRADLAAVGISVLPRPRSVAELVDHLRRRDTALFLAGVLNETGDAALSYEYVLRSREGLFGWANGGSGSSPYLDDLLEEATREPRFEEQTRLLHSIARVVAEDSAIVPLFVPTRSYVVRRDLELRLRPVVGFRASELRWTR